LQQQWRAIPEFQSKPNMSLRDILNDPDIRVIPWRELEIGERIGAGASGTVSKGVWRSSLLDMTRDVAIKQLIHGTQIYEDKMREFLVEIKLMSAMTHDNIVEFCGIAHNPETEELFLVTELVGRGNLRTVLDQSSEFLTWEMRLKLLRDVAKGMAYLHKRAIIHRDLKPQNILVTNDWVAKIVDFGVSTIKPQVTQTMTVIGTPKVDEFRTL
jgi:serine/threonine protein kinase